ncbi:hypothetical protein [Crocinitomix algicola]|uniref:hypothetical protein n=1 Tax=Crocinitomix algicola TaxID=1740263 RepID=UPI00082E4F49|nr:hypothetical protein [Crocinitomix algicola]
MALNEHIQNIANKAEQYAEAKFEEASLNTVEQSVNILSSILVWFIISGVALLTLAGLSIVCFYLLANWLESELGASLIIFGFFALTTCILIFNYKKLLTKPVKNFLLGQYLSDYKMKNDG